ncbi:MAG: glycosyltransferase [Rhizobiaceae bacterium]|nr:glycosyltransferase [Rhizobiaceae bacterium]
MSDERLTIDVCICTYRRPELAAAVRSVAEASMPEGADVTIIIADNDETPSAAPLAAKLAAEIALPVRYLHAPARNISLARNSCLEASQAQFIAFLDDDETASGDWLVSLVNAMEFRHADVVLGPVRAVYAPDAPDWLRKGDFHSTRPVWVDGKICTGYTCNVMMRMTSPFVQGKRFDLGRGQSGGEDTEFFDRVHRSGGRIAFAPEAWVDEAVPQERASVSWLVRRRFRSGQTHGKLLRARHSARALPKLVATAFAKAAYCAAFALLNVGNESRRNGYFLRGTLHVGAIAGLMGARELKQYGLVGSDQHAG